MKGFLLIGLIALAGCAATATAVLPDRAVTDRSHDVLVAYDNGDLVKLGRTLSQGYVHIDGPSTTRRADDLKVKPGQKYPTIARRTWSEESVYDTPGVRIFRGLADEEVAGNEVHGNFRFKGWYTLVWVSEDGDWRLGMMTYQLAGHESEDAWNAIYTNHVGFTTEPNKLLVAAVAGVRPGRALDVATGQGRNGLYLAAQGWKVTGVDFSMEGLREAREQADAKKLDFEPVYANLASYDFGVDRWDLVAVIYTPWHPEWIEKMKPSIRPGGLFVLEFFAKKPDDPGGADVSELDKIFAGWEIAKHEVVEDTPDWAENRATLVRFVAKRR